MSVCVWRPLLTSGVVSWQIIWTCFLGTINLQGEEKSSSLLTFFYYRIFSVIRRSVFLKKMCLFD